MTGGKGLPVDTTIGWGGEEEDCCWISLSGAWGAEVDVGRDFWPTALIVAWGAGLGLGLTLDTCLAGSS